jgi:hypothetical protein
MGLICEKITSLMQAKVKVTNLRPTDYNRTKLIPDFRDDLVAFVLAR